MATLKIDLPDEAFAALRRAPDEFAREMRLPAAVHWYSREIVSQEMAARIAGLDRTDFLRALAREEVAACQVDIDDLKEELERGLPARGERLAVDPPDRGRAP